MSKSRKPDNKKKNNPIVDRWAQDKEGIRIIKKSTPKGKGKR